jgi:hypothetical protein
MALTRLWVARARGGRAAISLSEPAKVRVIQSVGPSSAVSPNRRSLRVCNLIDLPLSVTRITSGHAESVRF